jgi:hypothetical protein
MEGTHEQNEYRKNPKTNFMLSAKRTKINQTSSEEMGGKYEIAVGHLAKYLTGRRKRKRQVFCILLPFIVVSFFVYNNEICY